MKALSPAVLNEAACCRAVLMRSGSCRTGGLPGREQPVRTLPKADAFSSAASSCWRSCMRAWSSEERLAPVGLLGDVAPEAAHELAQGVDRPPADEVVTDAGRVGDAREGVTEGGPAEPGDVRQLRVRGPEALGAGDALAGVLEDAGHRVAVLQVDRGGLRVEVADARAAAAAGDAQLYGVLGISGPPMPVRIQPSWVGFLHRVGARRSASGCSGAAAVREREAGVARPVVVKAKLPVSPAW